MKKVVWGVLSTARIGTQKVLPGMQKSECAAGDVLARVKAALGR